MRKIYLRNTSYKICIVLDTINFVKNIKLELY